MPYHERRPTKKCKNFQENFLNEINTFSPNIYSMILLKVKDKFSRGQILQVNQN